MTITEFKNLLEQNPDRPLRLVLPNRKAIPAHFHITEVGHVRKEFIDCGGTRRSVSTCLLQAWVAENDEEHSLAAGKLARIIELASPILPDGELPVEIEYEAESISQFPVADVAVTDEALIFQLRKKHTDCLAKEACGLTPASACGADTGCCG